MIPTLHTTTMGVLHTFQMPPDPGYSIVVEEQRLQAWKLWEPFQDDDVVV